jgi:chromosome partitioning protein
MRYKLISVSSIKGGVGKTSLVIHLSMALSEKHRVLVIDLDHNNNATDFFLRDADVTDIESKNIKQVFLEKTGIDDAVWHIEKGGVSVDIIPATPGLWSVGQELFTEPMALSRFTSYVRTLDYDVIIFDTPPARCFELQAALYSADIFLIPVSPNRWIIQNYTLMVNELNKVEQSTGRKPVIKVVPYMVSPTGLEFVRSVDMWSSTSVSFNRDQAVQNSTDGGRVLKEQTRSWKAFSVFSEEISLLMEGSHGGI